MITTSDKSGIEVCSPLGTLRYIADLHRSVFVA
jgi:hypothetical protein